MATHRTLQDMEERIRSVATEIRDLNALPEPSDNDVILLDTLIQEHDELTAAAEPLRARMEKISRIEEAHAEPDNVEPTEASETSARTRIEAPHTMFVRSGVMQDPLRDVNVNRLEAGMMKADEIKARAESLLELDVRYRDLKQTEAETAHERIHSPEHYGPRGGVAKHILLTGSEEYRRAFQTYLEDPVGSGWQGTLLNLSEGSSMQAPRYRAINLTNASGGFLLPYILDPTIVLTNNASANPYRRTARIVQTTSNAWQGVNSAGVTAAWVAEATTAADNSPTVGQIQITPQKAVAWVLGSYEALDDTNFGEQLPGLLADARDRLESAAFATGSGTAQPLGVLSALGTGSRVAPGATGTAFQSSTGTTGGNRDVLNLHAGLPPRFRNAPGATFLGSVQILNAVRALDVYGGGQFWTNFTTDTPMGLIGKQTYESSDLPTATTGASGASGTGNATLLFGDMAQFIIADRVGVSMLYDPMIKGSGNAQLPAGQAGWYMFWRVSSAVSTTAAFRYLTIS